MRPREAEREGLASPPYSEVFQVEQRQPAGGGRRMGWPLSLPAARLRDPKFRTTVLINAASILEKCDEQILPAVYAFVGASMDATPTQLGNITLGRALVQALSSPIGGFAGHFYRRGTVIGAGCLIWACMTALFAACTSVYAALPICAVNGLGLALVIPNVQSLTADYYASTSRGTAFGFLWVTISSGGMLGTLFATNIGAHRPLGIEGWRFAFLTVALVSAVVGTLNILFVHDPSYASAPGEAMGSGSAANGAGHSGGGGGGGHGGGSSGGSSSAGGRGAGGGGLDRALLAAVWRDIRGILRIPTFAIVIIQGIIGSVPYNALIFLTLYLQLMGMSNAHASLLVALYLGGGGLGGLLGGWIGDLAARRWPNHGRIVATQFSVLVGIPFVAVIFKALPLNGDPGTVAAYAVTILLFALATSWPAPCFNNPAFAEIVPQEQRTLIYAFDRCFEGAIAATSAPLVGLSAQRLFGFSGASTVTGDRQRDLSNARALGNALLAFCTASWTFCFVMYSGLHFTYPKDRRAALYEHGRLGAGAAGKDSEEAEGGAGGEESDNNIAVLETRTLLGAGSSGRRSPAVLEP